MRSLKTRLAGAARNPVVPWALFGVAVVAAVVFGVLLKVKADDVARTERAEDEARNQATEFVLTLTNVSFETLDEDVEELKQMATGRLLDEIDDLFSDEITGAMRDARVVLQGEIDDVFVQALGDDSATVFLVASLDVSNETGEQPAPGIARIELGLDMTSDGWKADRLELFQSPDQQGIFPAP